MDLYNFKPSDLTTLQKILKITKEADNKKIKEITSLWHRIHDIEQIK